MLAGRRDVLNSFDSVFGSIRSPSYATLLWGPRGTGKTVLLNAVEDRAGAQGWVARFVGSGEQAWAGGPDRIQGVGPSHCAAR